MNAVILQIYTQNVAKLNETEQLKLAQFIIAKVVQKKGLPKEFQPSIEILNDDFESVRSEMVQQFNDAIEKSAREVNL